MSLNNPVGLDGFEFMEFCAEDCSFIRQSFLRMGFILIGHHRDLAIELWQQGDVRFLINAQPDSYAMQFAKSHGPGVSAMGFRVASAEKGLAHCLEQDAKIFDAGINDWVG